MLSAAALKWGMILVWTLPHDAEVRGGFSVENMSLESAEGEKNKPCWGQGNWWVVHVISTLLFVNQKRVSIGTQPECFI